MRIAYTLNLDKKYVTVGAIYDVVSICNRFMFRNVLLYYNIKIKLNRIPKIATKQCDRARNYDRYIHTIRANHYDDDKRCACI